MKRLQNNQPMGHRERAQQSKSKQRTDMFQFLKMLQFLKHLARYAKRNLNLNG